MRFVGTLPPTLGQLADRTCPSAEHHGLPCQVPFLHWAANAAWSAAVLPDVAACVAGEVGCFTFLFTASASASLQLAVQQCLLLPPPLLHWTPDLPPLHARAVRII